MRNCLFCQIHKIKTDIIWKSKNFFVKVGIGILAPGHVMVVPKKHMSCFAELPKQLRKEFISIKEDIFNKVKSNFYEPIVYEHGIYGQSINHAHLHFLPSKNEYYTLENIKENFFKSMKSTQIDNTLQIREVFQREGSYFYLEQEGKKWIFHTKGLEEGKFTFRKEFAKLTGLHGLTDWQKMPEEEKQRNELWVNTTKEVFKL